MAIPTRSGPVPNPRVPLLVFEPISAVESWMLPKPLVATAEPPPSGAVPSEPSTVTCVNWVASSFGKTASAQLLVERVADVAVSAPVNGAL